jgi:hypothetical protein
VVLQAAYERALWGVDSFEISLIYAILISARFTPLVLLHK